MIQSAVQQDSSEVIRQLVEERKRQRLTQQELSDITGVRTSNIARFEGGTRIPTLLMLEKYANDLFATSPNLEYVYEIAEISEFSKEEC